MIELFDYQKTGAEWLAQQTKFALLADEMGLGKSAQAIHACDAVFSDSILVFCPAAACVNWAREFEKFSPIKRSFQIIKKRNEVQLGRNVICSYDLAPYFRENCTGTFDVMILDEAHFLKSATAKRTQSILGKTGFVHKTKRTFALSGTPMPNNPSELWPMLYTFGLTKLGFNQFVDYFCTGYPSPHDRNKVNITGAKTSAVPALRSILKNIMLRRKKEDVMKELPAITYADLVVEPGFVDIENESSFIQYTYPLNRRAELLEILKQERALVEAAVGRSGLGRDGMKLLEGLANSVSTLRRYSGLQKVEPVVEILTEELSSHAYEKVVIFAVHRDVIEGLRVKLAKFKPVTLYGGTDPDKRQQNIDKFMKNPHTRVFIGNIQAAGTAITLTSAHNVVFVEQDWVPGNNAQAAMRVHRIGQTKPVLVRFVGLADSIDEKVAQVLKRKTREITEIFDGGEKEVLKDVFPEVTPLTP